MTSLPPRPSTISLPAPPTMMLPSPNWVMVGLSSAPSSTSSVSGSSPRVSAPPEEGRVEDRPKAVDEIDTGAVEHAAAGAGERDGDRVVVVAQQDVADCRARAALPRATA